MLRVLLSAPAVVLTGIAVSGAPTAPRPGVDWPQFRGIAASGIAEGFSLPTTWNAGTGANILWKTSIPGLGLSSPVVWGDDIFISTAISGKTDANLKVGLYGDIASVQDDTSHEWRVYALDNEDRRDQMAADDDHRCAEGQAAHQVEPRQLDARHGRRADCRVLRIRGPLRLRHEGQAPVEEGDHGNRPEIGAAH